MPTFIRSAMNPNGTWQSDGMDQSEAFNANRADTNMRWNQGRQDQQGQSDLALRMLRERLGFDREVYQGGRADSAAARQAEAERWGKQFDYMGNRDKQADERWKLGFDQDRADRVEDRTWLQEQRARDVERYDAAKPMEDAKLQMVLAELEQMKQRQAARAGAAGAAIYTPKSDRGIEAQTTTLAATGDPLQAGLAAKQAERAQAMADAEAEASGVGRNVAKYAARDTKVFGSDPTEQDTAGIIKSVEALAQLYRDAGMSESQIRAKVQDLLMSNATGSDSWNAGNIQGILQRFGIQQ